MFSPQFRSRLLLLSGIALALGVIVATSKLFHVPAHREFGGSLLHEPSPIVAFVVVGTALVGCVVLCTLVAGRVRFDAGLFCAAVGAVALTARSGTVGDVLRARTAAGGGATVFVTFAAELVLLYALLGLAWSVLWMLHRQDYLKADQFRDGVEDTEDPAWIKVGALLMQAGVMALFMLLLAQTDSKTQVVWAVGISAYVGTIASYYVYPVSPSAWLWTGPMLVGLAGYVLAYFNLDVNDAAWRTGQLRFTFAALARALPLDYATAGTAGAVMGYWMGRKWYRQRMIEAGEGAAGTAVKQEAMEQFFGKAP